MITNPQKGSLRDKQILKLIEKCQALNTEQIAALMFRNISHGQRKARERLLKLYKNNRVKRCRYSLTEPFCYFIGKKHGRLEHLLDLNWAYVWAEKNLKSWEEIFCFNYEPALQIFQPDAFFGIKNKVTKRYKFYFIELDRSENPFDKVKKYNHWYESEGYIGEWWMNLADRFPVILIITTTTRRQAKIMECIDQENSGGLEFRVMQLDEMKEG